MWKYQLTISLQRALKPSRAHLLGEKNPDTVLFFSYYFRAKNLDAPAQSKHGPNFQLLFMGQIQNQKLLCGFGRRRVLRFLAR